MKWGGCWILWICGNLFSIFVVEIGSSEMGTRSAKRFPRGALKNGWVGWEKYGAEKHSLPFGTDALEKTYEEYRRLKNNLRP